MNDSTKQPISNQCSRKFSEFISSAHGKSLPGTVIHDFKRSLLDYISCVIAGSPEPIVVAMRACLSDNNCSGDEHTGASVSHLCATNSAFIDGLRAHALDFDDGYTQGSCHPGAVVFPAALAAAKKYGATAGQIISAVVTGYDIMLRISAAIHPTTAKAGFHNTSVAGVFGAAAAASAIMGLDEKRAMHALGLAASFSSGVLQFLEDGSDSKRIHAGKAARDGVLCAEMAAQGISGPAEGLEGKYGFFNAYARGDIRPQFLLDGLGENFLISRTYFKLYPCCRHYHAAVDAAQYLRQSVDFDVQQIERIEIGLYHVGVHGHDQTTIHNLLEAQMSAPCAVALSLLDGNVSNPSFSDESLARAALKDLMRKTVTSEDALCESLYPAVRSGTVSIHLTNGKVLEKRVENPKGEEANPLTDKELEEKFIKNSKDRMSDHDIDQLLQIVWNFDQCDRAAIDQLQQYIAH